MTLLLSAIWPGLAAALVLGTLVGALSGLPRGPIGLAIGGGLFAALVALVGLTVTNAAPGDAGLWVEGAAVMLAAYLVGCVLGGIGRRVAVKA